MDHETAEKQQTATKYLLNELNEEERKDFEEHFFECELCAEQVRTDFTIAENLKGSRSEQASISAPSLNSPPVRGWRQWLQPASLIPTFAALALALVLVYQNAATGGRIELLPDAGLIAPVARGGPETVIKVDRAQSRLLLTFSVDGMAKADPLVCEFLKASGSQVARFTTPAKKSDLVFLVPAKLFPSDRYSMVMHPLSEPQNATVYPFAIADSQ